MRAGRRWNHDSLDVLAQGSLLEAHSSNCICCARPVQCSSPVARLNLTLWLSHLLLAVLIVLPTDFPSPRFLYWADLYFDYEDARGGGRTITLPASECPRGGKCLKGALQV